MVADIHTGAGRLTQSVMGPKHVLFSLHALTSRFPVMMHGAHSDAFTLGVVICWTY